MKKIDRVLISSDDNPLYIQFLPMVSLAWQKILGVKPTLAYVTDKTKAEWEWMEEFCQDILVYPVDKELPNGKCRTFAARMVMRDKFGEDVCMISDLDMVPLSNRFQSLLENWSPEKLLVYGYNAYAYGDGDPLQPIHDPAMRKFPSCYCVASSKVWKEIVNPAGLTDAELINSWYNFRCYDHKEAINNENFDDESLVRALVQKWNPSRNKIIGVDRSIHHVGFMTDRLDRSNWINARNWPSINQDLLVSKYVDAHCPRPMKDYLHSMQLLADYLKIPFVFKE